jgi:hypothetical protein
MTDQRAPATAAPNAQPTWDDFCAAIRGVNVAMIAMGNALHDLFRRWEHEHPQFVAFLRELSDAQERRARYAARVRRQHARRRRRASSRYR